LCGSEKADIAGDFFGLGNINDFALFLSITQYLIEATIRENSITCDQKDDNQFFAVTKRHRA